MCRNAVPDTEAAAVGCCSPVCPPCDVLTRVMGRTGTAAVIAGALPVAGEDPQAGLTTRPVEIIGTLADLVVHGMALRAVAPLCSMPHGLAATTGADPVAAPSLATPAVRSRQVPGRLVFTPRGRSIPGLRVPHQSAPHLLGPRQ